MIVKSSVTSILLMLASCGKVDPNRVTVVDEAFIPYISRFEAEIEVSADGIDMNFSDLKGNIVGVCEVGWKERSVLIDKEFWDSSSESEKEELIYHELGHCAMNLDHDSELIKDGGCPKSIMYPEMLGSCYPLFLDTYKKELRSKKGS